MLEPVQTQQYPEDFVNNIIDELPPLAADYFRSYELASKVKRNRKTFCTKWSRKPEEFMRIKAEAFNLFKLTLRSHGIGDVQGLKEVVKLTE